MNLTLAALAAFAEEEPELSFGLFAIGNILATSVVIVPPLGFTFCVLAGLMYGAVLGCVAYVVTCAFGAWLTFLFTRMLRPHVIALLGEHASTWERIDAAITREGVVICMLWRIAPIAPFVLSSMMISLTAITQFDYVWTTSIGIIPSTIPIVSAAALGKSLASGEASTFQIAFNVVSILAGVYVVYRLAMIAKAAIERSGDDDESAAESAVGPTFLKRVDTLRNKFGDPKTTELM